MRLKLTPTRVENLKAPESGELIAQVRGNARAILSGERVGLNIVSYLSGIATLTSAYVAAADGVEATALSRFGHCLITLFWPLLFFLLLKANGPRSAWYYFE